MFSRRVKLIALAVIVAGITTLVVVRYTDACLLEQVHLDDRQVENWTERFGLDDTRSVMRQPIDSLAMHLLDKPNVFKVDIAFTLPNGIDVRTNDFDPACFVVDKYSGKLYGLSDAARIISLENCHFDWEHPVFTSVETGKLYDLCPDLRVEVAVGQLQKLRDDDIDLYRLIDEIDFGNREFLRVTVSGLPYRLKVRAEKLFDDVGRFVEFVSRFAPDLEGVKTIDLRFDRMIICAGGKV